MLYWPHRLKLAVSVLIGLIRSGQVPWALTNWLTASMLEKPVAPSQRRRFMVICMAGRLTLARHREEGEHRAAIQRAGTATYS